MSGWVEHRGAQRDIFASGSARRSITLAELPRAAHLHAIGPCEHLDGEITVLRGSPYVSKVRGTDYVVERGFEQGAIFLVWTQHAKWRDLAVPASVTGYAGLQSFVKSAAAGAAIDTSQAFPFLLSGAPARLVWHINVDRTAGQPVTRELFQKSKQSYELEREAVDVVGFYSERHAGVFISEFAPALGQAKNFMHLHFVSRAGKATGHIDDLRLDGGMTLYLPAP